MTAYPAYVPKGERTIDMRGDIVFQVYGMHAGRSEDMFFGAFRTRLEAQAEVEMLNAREKNGQNWARQYHNNGFVIRESVVETDFEIPSLPKPRDQYVVKTTPKPVRPETWDVTNIEVFRRDASGELDRICAYSRNYAMLQTFEPFRQGSREFALISRDYTRTAVLDLKTGQVIAEEPGDPHGAGFCPVGFYVPDWWDVNAGSVIPGSKYWSVDREWPAGDFGFVWGCIWGDDSSWKVQYLDLSRVQQGILDRQERFGYVELAASGFKNPCLITDGNVTGRSKSPDFIRLYRENGIISVTFSVEMKFDLATGKSEDWQRSKVNHLE
jgi:hypothetical protein